MKVILRQAVTGIGGPGTVKDVADGYARNFLLPRGLAEVATPDKLRALAEQQESKAKAMEERAEEFQAILSKLDKVKVSFQKKATKTGKLFAAITPEHIATELGKALKTDIDPAMLEIAEPVKSVGEHTIKLVMSPELVGEFKVTVEPGDK